MGCPDCAAAIERAAAAEQEVARLKVVLRTRGGGRPPKAAWDQKSRLVAAACAALGVSRTDLADRLGVQPARLSPSGKLAAKDRERLMEKLRALAGQEGTTA